MASADDFLGETAFFAPVAGQGARTLQAAVPLTGTRLGDMGHLRLELEWKPDGQTAPPAPELLVVRSRADLEYYSTDQLFFCSENDRGINRP